MMSAFFKKYQFWFKCWWIVWGILAIVFSFYMVTFFLGNHDWQFIRYDMPLGSGIWEARITQFLPPRLFSLGRLLPIWNALLGFGFLSAAAVLLAWWYGLKPKATQVILFSLLIGLHPYVCASLYYAYLFLSFGCWHFLSVLGIVLAWQFANNHKFYYFIGAMVCLWCALSGYAACVELIGVLVLGKFMLECSVPLQKGFIKRWGIFFLVLFVALTVYVLSLRFLQHMEILDSWMYNTQALPFSKMILRFINKWQMPFVVLGTDLPYVGKGALAFFWGLVLVFNLVLWRAFEFKKYVIALLLEIGVFYAAFVAAYISPSDIFYMYRVHVFSVPYLVAVMLAVILLQGKNVYKNAAYVIGICLVWVFVQCNLMTQKVWYLGSKQDDKIVERIKINLLPRMDKNKHYRLSTLGNLYGCRKFAKKQFIAVTPYEEYYNMPYILDIFFSNGFFAYEPYNPIWGDTQYMPSWVIFYGTSNENIASDERNEAAEFSKYSGHDKDNLIKAVRRLRPFPREPYMAVGDKDIILMLGNTQYEDLLVKTIQED
jgi:hypothetical protein